MINHPAHLRPPLTSIRRFLDYYARTKERDGQPVFCFQIGANDGRTNDPVHRFFRDHGWYGLLVEPQRDVFEQGLSRTYADNPRVQVANVALGRQEGSLPFYRVAISRARWASGLSSFVRATLEDHIRSGYIQRKAAEEGIPLPQDPADIIETVQVPTATVDGLLSRHQVERFDVLCIDTEGYDYEILRLVDLRRYRPEVVLFESNNLSEQDFAAAHRLMAEQGYRLFWENGDTLAVDYPYPPLLWNWHRAKAFWKARRTARKK